MLIFSAVLGLLLFQDPPPKPPKHKIEVKLAIEPADKRWQFRISGTTDLPDKTVLRLRVFAIEVVTIMGESREEEEGLCYRGGAWYKDVTLKGGKFSEIVFDTAHKPYSLRYRGRAFYDTESQDEELAKTIGDESFSAKDDVAWGDPKNFDAELREAAKSIADDLDVIQRLFSEVKNMFSSQRARYVAKDWLGWKKEFLARVDKLRAKNDERWELWAAWVERQGRFRVTDFCEMLKYLVEDECAAVLEKGDEEALKSAQQTISRFPERFEEAREVVGLDAPFDIETVTAVTKRYAAAVEAVKKTAGADWDKGAESRGAARDAILRLSDQKLVPRRGYERVVRVAGSLTRLLELGPDAASKPDAWKRAVTVHDEALRDFMNYAQIKP